MSDVLNVASLDAPTRAALERHILRLADSKRLMGIRYSDWTLGAPSVETGIAMSSMTQDEWGHARLLYSMLKELDLRSGGGRARARLRRRTRTSDASMRPSGTGRRPSPAS